MKKQKVYVESFNERVKRINKEKGQVKGGQKELVKKLGTNQTQGSRLNKGGDDYLFFNDELYSKYKIKKKSMC